MNTHVLALDVSGQPRTWLTMEDAVVYYAKNLVAWELGSVVATLRGGFRRFDGQRSEISTASIIAIRGDSLPVKKFKEVPLTNRSLFGRDRYLCAYCGKTHHVKECSREHILPVSKGGPDTWMNVVTACKRCNHHKGAKTLEQAGMELLYAPYVPNNNEHLILQNRNVMADQMEYLLAGVPRHSRLLIN